VSKFFFRRLSLLDSLALIALMLFAVWLLSGCQTLQCRPALTSKLHLDSMTVEITEGVLSCESPF
jgi:hypothetical protein